MEPIVHDIQANNHTLTGRARKFFTRKEDELLRIYICLLCNKPCNGTKAANIVSHIRSCHKAIYEEKVKSKDKSSQTYLLEKRLKLLQICVKKTTIDHEPFASILKESFQELTSNKLQKFTDAGITLNLTNKNLTVVKDHIHSTANKIRSKIEDEMKCRLVSLMVDGASKHNRSVLGISAQYILNGQLKIRMLALKELTDSHTGDYLGSVVRNCFEHYNCDISQAIAVTTDNASNMVKMTRDLNVDCEAESTSGVLQPFEDVDENIDQSSCDDEIGEFLRRLEELELEETNEILNDNSVGDEFEEDNMNLVDPNDIISSAIFVNHVNCAAHTIQLVVLDALKKLSQSDQNVIIICREFAKFVRRSSSIVCVEKLGIKRKLPKLDCPTRWSSTYIMVSICAS